MNMINKIGVIILTLAFVFIPLAAESSGGRGGVHTYSSQQGFVPDEITAVAIAEAILIPIYGRDRIQKQKPYVANLTNGVWTITGVLPQGQLGGYLLFNWIKMTQG